jgi:hypothetical protein
MYLITATASREFLVRQPLVQECSWLEALSAFSIPFKDEHCMLYMNSHFIEISLEVHFLYFDV